MMATKLFFGDTDVLNVLRVKITQNGLRPTARELGFSAPYTSDLANGKRNLSEVVAGKLGFTLVAAPPTPPRIWRSVKQSKKAGKE